MAISDKTCIYIYMYFLLKSLTRVLLSGHPLLLQSPPSLGSNCYIPSVPTLYRPMTEGFVKERPEVASEVGFFAAYWSIYGKDSTFQNPVKIIASDLPSTCCFRNAFARSAP